ncbi:MAG: TIGR03016 family PEP-CTERM system-associated outer membrane protein [Woeseiaceae bacterium]|nr:TIGR03016 family PEP-CTERM system-associated outer membrane protein [Woeseiaceae bacterium]
MFLADEGLEESETVYQVSPTINLTKESERVNANITYAPQALFYEDTTDADEVYHVLDAALNTVLLRDRFFLDFSAVNFQIVDAAENRFPTSNIPITTRRTDTAIWSVTPRWQERIGPAQMLAQGTFRQTNFDEFGTLGTLDSDEKSGMLQFNNLHQNEGVSWALRYQYMRLDYDGEALPWEYQQASAELGYWIGAGLRIFGSGGVETPFDAFLEPDMKDTFWEAGFAYNPDERLELEIAAGERSFGTSLRGRLAYEMRRGRTELTYSENPSTQNNALSGRRPIQQTDNLDDFLARIDNNNKFVRKRAEWLNSIELNKTSITLRLFNEEREETFTLEGDPRPDESYRGAALRIDWDAGARLSLGLTGDIADRDRGGSEEELTRFGVDASYRLSRRFTLTARAQRSEAESQGGGFGFRNYTENQYQLILRTEIL